MKTEDKEKINAVGQTLGVELSDIKRAKKQKMERIKCAIIQGIIALGSMLLGFGLGMTTYPYSLPPMGGSFWWGLGFETLIQTGNRKFLFQKVGVGGDFSSYNTRMKIFLGNLLLSFALFVISFGNMANWGSNRGPGITLYGTYDHCQRKFKSE